MVATVKERSLLQSRKWNLNRLVSSTCTEKKNRSFKSQKKLLSLNFLGHRFTGIKSGCVGCSVPPPFIGGI